MRLDPTEVFENGQQQHFLVPTVQLRFPSITLDQSSSAGSMSAQKNNEKIEPTEGCELAAEEAEPPVLENRQPTFVMPYVPGIGDQLKQIAQAYDISTWFAYPGSGLDQFTEYRGRLPLAKMRHSIYQCVCSCGEIYISESSRNLKVRVSGHLQCSSRSAFSDHLQNKQHRPSIKDTVVISREKNTVKRKLIESIAIDHSRKNKDTSICNSGLSSDLPPIWQICSRRVAKQLNRKTTF